MERNCRAAENPWLVIVPRLPVFSQADSNSTTVGTLPLCAEVEVQKWEGGAAYVRSESLDGWVLHAAMNLEPKRSMPPLTHRVISDAPAGYPTSDGGLQEFILPASSRFAVGRIQQNTEGGALLEIQGLLNRGALILSEYTEPLTDQDR